jgi:peptidoglycan/LPS O-acetylase OafA/YrhL
VPKGIEGGIYAWAAAPNPAQLEASTPGATYTGLAIGSVGGTPYLYAANDAGTTGGINVFNGTFTNVTGTTFAGKFLDPLLPAGYVPFNVQNIGGGAACVGEHKARRARRSAAGLLRSARQSSRRPRSRPAEEERRVTAPPHRRMRRAAGHLKIARGLLLAPLQATLRDMPASTAARRNNFDALRLLAAVSVIFSHAFLIAQGTQKHEWLILLTGNQSILGLCGVFVFFAISGFLVTQSFELTGDPLRFLTKRALRIFPGLFVATLLSALVLAPFVTTLQPGAYFSQPQPYQYVLRNTLLNQSVHELPGVMFVNNPAGLEINGAMWTLRCEFMMYLMVLGLGTIRLLSLPMALGLLALGIACLYFPQLGLLGGWGWTLAFFAAGMILYKLRNTRIFDGRVALLALAGLALSVPLRQFIPLFPVFGCYLALWLALTPRLPVIQAARFGDLSYGLYIYGWPVEEAVIWLRGGQATWWQLFAIALPATAVLAFLSWHLVESPALRLKPGAPRPGAGFLLPGAATAAILRARLRRVVAAGKRQQT